MKRIRVLGIIPARGGSKGVPYKNIALLGGKPLIWHTIQAAKQSRMIDAFIVSTDDLKISQVAKRYGADVPFLRPVELAQDTSPDIEFMLHAIEWVKKHRSWEPEIIVNLRPTSPLRTSDTIDAAIKAALASNATLIKTVSPISTQNPFKMWHVEKMETTHIELRPLIKNKLYRKLGTDVPRQILPRVYWQNGLVDVLRVSAIKKGQGALFERVCGVITDPALSIDLDSIDDFKTADRILKKRRMIKQKSSPIKKKKK